MVKLTSIITKTGDDGTTALSNGERRPKYDLRVKAYGTIDEVNSLIGLARALLDEESAGELAQCLAFIQNHLFDLGADLSSPFKNASKHSIRIQSDYTDFLEKESHRLNHHLPPLDSFILPFGTKAVCAIHIARSTARRAERLISALQKQEEINLENLRYINRLSDLLFIMARYHSLKQSSKEEKWQPQNKNNI